MLKKTPKVAIFCAEGLGDALIMMIASHAYQKAGYEVTTFTNHLAKFKQWLQGYQFADKPTLEKIQETLAPFDIILLQHENSPKARTVYALKDLFPEKTWIAFYNNYRLAKHAPLRQGLDFAFEEKESMVKNLGKALQELLHLPYIPQEIGMQIPSHLQYRKYPKRIVIHPTSSSTIKNWLPSKFLSLAKTLKKQGFDPCFCLREEEKAPFLSALQEGITIPELKDLTELGELIYESGYFIGNDSGPGHLASYLKIPSVIIAPCKKRLSHWQPGWQEASIVSPPKWVPNLKGMRWKSTYWAHFLSVRRVLLAWRSLV